MKTVQVMFDEDLLAELDETADVRQKGRSAVLRQLASDFLRQRRQQEIDAQYERAYAGVSEPLGEDFAGWEEEGVWPPE
ncbi:MAG TPA: ribbon-helix-helix protein, CopG family [Thermoanaerobaculia bacterium]|jgi:metal-responsive CopG/Arc/MetJ family transcriptional regulator|nr:ribbon-helix-helix protein, CopG family [Thermoanaerobaculia bacterium]